MKITATTATTENDLTKQHQGRRRTNHDPHDHRNRQGNQPKEEGHKMITIKINTDNSAFQENPNEIRSILTDLGHKLQNSKEKEGNIKDTNGNTVGSWKIT
jgi:hypothetical protein